jgi:opacity protein-like surface antigen
MLNLNLSSIKNWIKTKTTLKDLSFIGLIVICAILYGTYKQTKNDLQETQRNLIAATDTIKVTKNKLGENVYKINSLTADYKQLKEINSELVLEINKLSKKDKKNLVEINKLNLTINLLQDSIKELNNQLTGFDIDPVTGLTTYNYELKDSTKFRELRGTIKVTTTNQPSKVNTVLTMDKVYTDLVIGKTLKNDKLELFVTSSNSGLVVNNIQGSVIDLNAYTKLQPKKRFSVGLQAGYGLTIYGATPYVGVGVSYNLFNF